MKDGDMYLLNDKSGTIIYSEEKRKTLLIPNKNIPSNIEGTFVTDLMDITDKENLHYIGNINDLLDLILNKTK